MELDRWPLFQIMWIGPSIYLENFQHVANLAISNSARLHIEHPTSPSSRFLREINIP
jgi:hypothetical protein